VPVVDSGDDEINDGDNIIYHELDYHNFAELLPIDQINGIRMKSGNMNDTENNEIEERVARALEVGPPEDDGSGTLRIVTFTLTSDVPCGIGGCKLVFGEKFFAPLHPSETFTLRTYVSHSWSVFVDEKVVWKRQIDSDWPSPPNTFPVIINKSTRLTQKSKRNKRRNGKKSSSAFVTTEL